jgi:hypothetical protein
MKTSNVTVTWMNGQREVFRCIKWTIEGNGLLTMEHPDEPAIIIPTNNIMKISIGE